MNITDMTLDLIYDTRSMHEAVIAAYYGNSPFHAEEVIRHFEHVAPLIEALRDYMKEQARV